jgi:hypothetical protein
MSALAEELVYRTALLLGVTSVIACLTTLL